MKFLGLAFEADSAAAWGGAAVVLLAGIALFEMTRRRFAVLWNRTQETIEDEIQRREAEAA
jgi:branched-chain amino acid transport system permease protein